MGHQSGEILGMAQAEEWIVHKISAAMLLFWFLVCGGLVLVGLAALQADHGKIVFFGYVLLAIAPFALLMILSLALNGGVAFKYNAEAIHVTRLIGVKRMAWAKIKNVSIVETTQTTGYGLVKVGSTQHLYVHPSFGFKVNVPTQWLSMKQDEMHQLAGLFEMLRRKAAGTVPTQATSSAPQDTNNDYADEMVARYMELR
jgi:hypothetical protein